MRKSVMVTGSTGMLGHMIVRAFLDDKRYSVTGMGRSFTNLLPRRDQILVDFARPSTIRSLDIKADAVIHTAAVTDLNLCESDQVLAATVNVEATGEVARTLRPGGLFFYISTDSVFDGQKGNYLESDIPNPLNNYALTKLRGEEISRILCPESIVLRTNIYGFHQGMKNSLAEWAFAEWRKGKKISGFTDVIFNALYTNDLAAVIKSMVDNNIYYPVLNVASQEILSKYEFLNVFREKLGVSESLLEVTTSGQFPSSIKRPLNTSLDIGLLKGFHTAPSVHEGLEAWIRDARRTQVHPINN